MDIEEVSVMAKTKLPQSMTELKLCYDRMNTTNNGLPVPARDIAHALEQIRARLKRVLTKEHLYYNEGSYIGAYNPFDDVRVVFELLDDIEQLNPRP